MIRKLAAAALRLTRLEPLVLLARASPLLHDGWFRSFRLGRAVDGEGRPIPWISYPAIEFLSARVPAGLDVFEYGAGSGTLWWAGRARRVVAVEHDEAWYRRMSAQVPANVRLLHVPLEPAGTYARSILDEGAFDVVIIDGRERVECARIAPERLNPRGVIVFDNSDRAEYAEGYRALEDRGFRRIEFSGMAPAVIEKIGTSIFYRPDNCLGI